MSACFCHTSPPQDGLSSVCVFFIRPSSVCGVRTLKNPPPHPSREKCNLFLPSCITAATRGVSTPHPATTADGESRQLTFCRFRPLSCLILAEPGHDRFLLLLFLQSREQSPYRSVPDSQEADVFVRLRRLDAVIERFVYAPPTV